MPRRLTVLKEKLSVGGRESTSRAWGTSLSWGQGPRCDLGLLGVCAQHPRAHHAEPLVVWVAQARCSARVTECVLALSGCWINPAAKPFVSESADSWGGLLASRSANAPGCTCFLLRPLPRQAQEGSCWGCSQGRFLPAGDVAEQAERGWRRGGAEALLRPLHIVL